MGFLENFLGKVNMGGDESEDEYTDEDEGFDEEEEEYEEEPSTPVKKAATNDEELSFGNTDTLASKKRPVKSGKVVTMKNTSLSTDSANGEGRSEVCMILPKGYDSSNEIAEFLLKGKTVILNMEGLNIDTAQRIIDFTSGACFTMGGNLQKIAKKIFVATPSTVSLTGDFSELFGEPTDSSNMNFTV